jgi:hypothetical protein
MGHHACFNHHSFTYGSSILVASEWLVSICLAHALQLVQFDLFENSTAAARLVKNHIIPGAVCTHLQGLALLMLEASQVHAQCHMM